MKPSFAYLVCTGAAIFYSFLVALPARAVDVTWYLNNVDFSDGSTATGSFIYDTTTLKPVEADITLTEAGSSPVVFTSGDLGTTFASYNSNNSTFNRLTLCSATSGTDGSTCSTNSTILVLSTINDFTSTTSNSENLSLPTDSSSLLRTNYSTFGSNAAKAIGISGSVYQVPFNVPGGEGSVLLGGVLAMGVVRRLKNYSSSTKIANSTSVKLVD